MNFFAISGILVSITALTLIILLSVYGKTRLHRIWTLFNVSVFIWGLGTFLAGAAKNLNASYFGWAVALCGGVFIATFFYHTVCVFTEIQRKPLIFISYFVSIVGNILFYSNKIFLMTDNYFIADDILYFRGTVSYSIIMIFWLFFVFLGYYELIKYLVNNKGLKRLQGKYLCIGALFGFLGGLTVHLPFLGIKIYPAGNYGVALYSIIVTYAILKYRLMDVKVAITRLGIFIIVYSLVLGVPFGLMTFWRNRLTNFWGEGWVWVPMISLLILATAGPYIYIFLQKKADKKLLADQKQYQQILIQASMGMNRIKELDHLLNLIVHIVTKTVRINHAEIYLLDPQTNKYVLKAARFEKNFLAKDEIDMEESLIKYLEKTEAAIVYEEIKQRAEELKSGDPERIASLMQDLQSEMIVPNIVNKKLIGLLNLGKKKSGKMYTQDDISVFSILSNQSALAIENAMFYEESGKDLAQRFHESRLKSLGALGSGVSHQIHNRLNVITFGGGLVLKNFEEMNEAQSKEEIWAFLKETISTVESMTNSAFRGTEITQAILNYSKADVTTQAIQLDLVLKSSVTLVNTKHVNFKYELEKSINNEDYVWANFATLQDVLFNMIDNSCDAMQFKKLRISNGNMVCPNYKPKIVITTEQKNLEIIIHIEDNGIGMTKETLDKMFVPYFTTKGAKKGTGMGMNMAFHLLKANKGMIEVQSEYEKWTRINISLPKATKEQVENNAQKENQDGNKQNSSS